MAAWSIAHNLCPSCSGYLGTGSAPSDTSGEIPPASKRPKQNSLPCQYCLDLLDSNHQSAIIDKTIDYLTNENYVGIKSFQLCVSVPPSLVLHQGIIEMSISKDGKCRNLFDSIKERLKFKVISAVSSRMALAADIESPLHVSLLLSHSEGDERYKEFVSERKGGRKPTKKKLQKHTKQSKTCYTQTAVREILETVPYSEMESLGLVPTAESLLENHCNVEIKCTYDSLYLAGRYNKYSRTLSQSPWVVDGIKKASSSVQEIMNECVMEVFRPDTIKFSSSGREDIDVRMLGKGRPFMLEMVNPRKVTFDELECSELCKAINDSTREISVSKLKMVDRQTGDILKAGEEEKEKLYSALIWSSSPLTDSSISFLNDISDLSIVQKTPIRVLHRRSLASRERVIHTLKAKLIDGHHFQLDLSTQAGTYIKEFVHGDFGRTVPNLCQLMGHDVDIVLLDVTDILLEWPP